MPLACAGNVLATMGPGAEGWVDSAASKRPSRGKLSQRRIGALSRLAQEVVRGCLCRLASASGVSVFMARIVVCRSARTPACAPGRIVVWCGSASPTARSPTTMRENEGHAVVEMIQRCGVTSAGVTFTLESAAGGLESCPHCRLLAWHPVGRRGRSV